MLKIENYEFFGNPINSDSSVSLTLFEHDDDNDNWRLHQ